MQQVQVIDNNQQSINPALDSVFKNDVNARPFPSVVPTSDICELVELAKRHDRDLEKCMKQIKFTVGMSKEIAKSCIYSLPRGDKVIEGASIRLAEIAASCWGNLRMAQWVIGVVEKKMVACARVIDFEKLIDITIQKERRCVDKNGKLYSDDIQVLTGNATASIALREAIFKVIPKVVIEEALRVARAKIQEELEAETSTYKKIEKIETVIAKLSKFGLTKENVLYLINRSKVEDITSDDYVTLIGMGSALNDGYTTKAELLNSEDDDTIEKSKAEHILDKIKGANKNV